MNYSIHIAAKRAGLTPHVIRVWERRYQAVDPARTPSNRRLYSDKDVERLALLRRATAGGHRIGNIVTLSQDQLRHLVEEIESGQLPQLDSTTEGPRLERDLEQALAAIQDMDRSALGEVLESALLTLGHQGLLQRLIAPLAQRIGELWHRGDLTAAHEHFATACISGFLYQTHRPYALTESAPCLVVTTPAGQLHELGAMMVRAAATSSGWKVAYLGTSLPAAEIALAARQQRARAVALSLVYPQDDPNLRNELRLLRQFLPSQIAVLAGGRAARSYSQSLEEIGAIQSDDIASCYRVLQELRSPGVESPLGAKPIEG